MSELTLSLLAGLAGGALLSGLVLALVLRARGRTAATVLETARLERQQVLAEARRDADAARASADVEARMEALRLREEQEEMLKGRREEADRALRRAEEQERTVQRRTEEFERRERALADRERALVAEDRRLEARRGEVDALVAEQAARLERVAGLTADEAAGDPQRVEDEARTRPPPSRGTSRSRPGGTPTRTPAASSPWPSAAGCRAHRRNHRGGRAPAQRRDEGPHHRARGAEHPRLRARPPAWT
jgi:hypothetical protein